MYNEVLITRNEADACRTIDCAALVFIWYLFNLRSFSLLIAPGLSNQLLLKYKYINMQVFVGSNVYEVDASTSVETLMNQVENKEFIPAGSFCLRKSNGATLEIGSLLEVEEDDELTISLVVPAGMRAKWRKKRMRRLRRKRRKMRQRAR